MRALAVVLAIIVLPQLGEAQALRAIRVPSGAPAPSTSHEELALVRIGVLRAGRRITAEERPALAATMEAAYSRMHERAGSLPSVFAASHTERQSAQGFDALIAEPSGAPRFGVVFLHGYGGNFTWPCFAVAEAARAEGGVTICPSQGSSGRWAEGDGPAIARESMGALRARGVDRIVLAGLSSGGVGATRLLPSLAVRLAGVVLLSGVLPRRTTLPALVIHGTSDRMIAFRNARTFARRSPASSLLAIEGGHFVVAEHTDEIQAALRDWLRLHIVAEPAAHRPATR